MKKPKPVMVRLVRTCTACPAQWDAWDSRGQQYYIRYRHGQFTVDAVSGPNWVTDRSEVRKIIDLDYGHEDGGWMDETELFDLTDDMFVWDVQVERGR